MRLIDADALKEYIDIQKGRPFIGCTIGEALKIMTDEQPTAMAWVPVTERLPEKTGKYLVSMRNGNVYTKCFDTFTNSFGTGVLAWMELPEAYEEEDDED